MISKFGIFVGLMCGALCLGMAGAAVRESPRVGVAMGPAGPRFPSSKADDGTPVQIIGGDNTVLPGGNGPSLEYADASTLEYKFYTPQDCMSALEICVTAAYNGGLNDLYDADARNQLLTDPTFCASQVTHCINNTTVRGRPVYKDAIDVWRDFNSRVIAPSYYDFVVRQTGLSPAQAEYTCLMLDKADGDNVPTHLIGKVPLSSGAEWVSVNDLMTGNARWDAASASCMVRIGAYNKDNVISNSWLFGIAGDDRAAESWRKTGDVFTCGKDLFGFGLMTNTKTVAVVGVGGGTVVGAGTGAIIGYHQQRDFSCANGDDRAALVIELRQKNLITNFLDGAVGRDGKNLTVADCQMINQMTINNPDIAGLAVWRGKDAKTLQGALIGAGTGAAAGGLATAITSFVERNNITCRIGGGIGRVGYNKSGVIDGLKDFYAKWQLTVPDVVGKSTVAQTCDVYKSLCDGYDDAYTCGNVRIQYGSMTDAKVSGADGACLVVDGKCTALESVSRSRGICD